MPKKIAIILLILLTFTLSSCSLTKGPDAATQKAMQPVTLNYWRVFDDQDDFKPIIDAYRARHPFVTINYRKLRYDEYEQALLEAFATDTGPDIFSIHNTWTRKYQSKGFLEPMPAKTIMAYPYVEGKLKKEVVTNLQSNKSLSLNQIKNDFVDVVYNDIVIKVYDETTNKQEEKIFGLPLSVDTLALYYNKDLFNNAGITKAPEYWNREFQQDVKKLTKQNNKGEIIQSGVSLGGAENIVRSSDIVSVLMMQNGTEMMSEGGQVKFNLKPANFQDKNYNPGLDALRFYSDFANPAKEVYCWNKSLDNSLDLFLEGELAIMFGYSYMLPTIKADAPKLNFNIVKLPQIEGNPQSINFANYWVEVVSKKSVNTNTAWDFLKFMAEKNQVKNYLEKAKKPTALRSLVDEQSEDAEIGIFTQQTLTAKSWYKGVNPLAAEAIMMDMIESALVGQDSLENIINLAASKVQQTIKD